MERETASIPNTHCCNNFGSHSGGGIRSGPGELGYPKGIAFDERTQLIYVAMDI